VLWLCQVTRPVPRLCLVIRNKYWGLRGRVVSPPPNPQAGGPPTVGCPRLLIQDIRSYPPYLEAVSSIRNPRTRHAVVTVDPLNMVAEDSTKNPGTISSVKIWTRDLPPRSFLTTRHALPSAGYSGRCGVDEHWKCLSITCLINILDLAAT
jgi:hypothetical protein